MFKYIIKRILSSIPIILIITIIAFTLIQLAPYDAIDTIIKPTMSQEQIDALKAAHGLDKPAIVQYFYWLKNVMQGDLGNSIVHGSNIAQSLAERIPNTIALVLPAFMISFVISVILGLLAGANKGKRIDRFVEGLCSIGISIPTFWIAILLIIFFASTLKLLPTNGMYTIGGSKSFYDFLLHAIMPWTTLVIGLTPEMIKYVRSSTIGQLNEDYVLVQKAYGASNFKIISVHVFKNVLIPIVTIFGTLLPMLVTGAFVTESIFSWPGVGKYFLDAVKQFDYPIIMAVLLISSALVIIGNLIADILYCVIDPRIREMKS